MDLTSATPTAATTRGGSDRLVVTVNGEARTLPVGATVASLLAAHDLDPRLVVVELNREILRDRDAFPARALAAGDTIEIVHFVGGG